MKKKNHRIRVKVEIVECEEETTNEEQSHRLGDGEFELLIDEAVAGSIDDCEQALLATKTATVKLPMFLILLICRHRRSFGIV